MCAPSPSVEFAGEQEGMRVSEQMRPLEESATHALDGLASRWNAWLRRTDSLEMVVEIEALGERVTCANRVLRKTGLLRRLTWVEDGVPDALVHDAVALRGATTRADGAAWTWAFLSISTRDGELTTDFDYERRPDLVPPCTRDDCAAEQRLFPRDSGRLPGWMARLQSDDVEDAVSRTDSDGDGEAGFRRPLGRLALQPR